jgi:Fe-S-cluster containining protein
MCCLDIKEIEVTIDFLFRLTNHLNIPLEQTLNFCKLEPILEQPPYGNVYGLTLKHPCSFLKDNCTIHNIKPTTCLSFPTKTFIEGSAQSFPDYPCLNGTIEPPDMKDTHFFSDLHQNRDNNIDKKIFYNNNQPFIDIRKLDNNIIKQCLTESQKPITDLTKEQMDEINKKIITILREEFKKELNIETIKERIKNITEEDKEIITNLNNQYYKIRNNYDL